MLSALFALISSTFALPSLIASENATLRRTAVGTARSDITSSIPAR